MSIKIITAAFELPSAAVNPCERLVLLVLAWHADQNGRNAWPSVRTISRKTSLTERAVQKILVRLKEKRLIAIESKAARRSVRYAVALDELHRELRSQSSPDCEPSSQSPQADCEPSSPHPERSSPSPRTTFAPTPNEVHPIRPVTVRESSWEEEPRAARARALPEQTTTTEKSPEGNGHRPGPWTKVGEIEFQQAMASMRGAVKRARRWR